MILSDKSQQCGQQRSENRRIRDCSYFTDQELQLDFQFSALKGNERHTGRAV